MNDVELEDVDGGLDDEIESFNLIVIIDDLE